MKKGRHSRIIEIIEKNMIETQEELAELLRAEGYDVTQATVSRDIRELQLSKIPTKEGKQVYTHIRNDNEHLNDKYARVLKDGYISMDAAQNILVVKTVAGMAMAVAAAIDALKMSAIVGSIAGDDAIMIVVRTNEDAQTVMNNVRKELEV